jgi:hypothetical protein
MNIYGVSSNQLLIVELNPLFNIELTYHAVIHSIELTGQQTVTQHNWSLVY